MTLFNTPVNARKQGYNRFSWAYPYEAPGTVRKAANRLLETETTEQEKVSISAGGAA